VAVVIRLLRIFRREPAEPTEPEPDCEIGRKAMALMTDIGAALDRYDTPAHADIAVLATVLGDVLACTAIGSKVELGTMLDEVCDKIREQAAEARLARGAR
jgi:hypothetical protein